MTLDNRLRQALRSVSTAVTAFSETTMDYERLLETVVRSIGQVLDDTCIVSLLADDGRAITPVAMYDASPTLVEAFAPRLHQRFELTEAQVSADVLTHGTMFTPVLDLAALEGRMHSGFFGLITRIHARGMIVVPLKSRGEQLGVLLVLRHRVDAALLDEIDLELTEHLANHAALALGNAKLFQRATAEAQQRERVQDALAQSERLRASEARALEATRFVDTILENIPDMVFVKDANELRFVRFNRAGEELLGIARDKLIGKNDFDLFPAAEAEFFVAKDRQTLQSKAMVDIPEEPIHTGNGERWLHTKKVPIIDDDGVPRYLLGISQDITDHKRAVAALAAAKDKAEAANRELEAFSYSVAHDLRAPLRAIDGFAQALLEDYGKRLDAVGNRHLERIRAAAQRMAALIDDLLELSRVTRAEHKRELVDLSRLARVAVATLERSEPDRTVTISIDDGLKAHGDPKLLSIVFDNLFGNAWKFTKHVEHPQIELGSKLANDERVFYIRDNGAGFDNTYQHKLFGVFQRLHPAHEFPGTGIGLATVKRIIERHGGRVWAESQVGKGSTFYFTLGDKPEAS